MKVDYIVVGLGLAGIAFCEKLRTANKSFVVYDNNSQQSSMVAAGMYNPVILKRFTAVWNAKEQLKIALPIYSELETLLNVKLNYPLTLYRRFASIEEQNTWFMASDKPKLAPYMATQLVTNTNPEIDAPYKLGQVLQAGRVDTTTLILNYKKYLQANSQLITNKFQHEKLKVDTSSCSYKDLQSKHIVFCEGYGIKQNPFFKNLPLQGTKGEVLTIKAPKLKSQFTIKSAVFIMPKKNDLYYVGATYNRFDKTSQPTETGKAELITKVKTFLKTPFKIEDHKAGIRPTVKDRRPLVGTHPDYKNIHVLNGLGSRGVMIAPYAANQLYNHIENKEPLHPEISISRFI